MINTSDQPGLPVPCSGLMVIDQVVFTRTASYLAPSAIASYLENIVNLCEGLLCNLDIADFGINREVAARAHTLAGSAGLLGFERLAEVGRRFEQAILSDSNKATELADDFRTALEVTLQEIRGMLAGINETSGFDT